MLNVVLASHGKLSSGMKNSVEMILGEKSNLYAIEGYTNEKNTLESGVNNVFSKFDPEDKVVIITDILGGSVNNYFYRLMDEKKFVLITGMNLGLVIQLMVTGEETIDINKIEQLISESKEGIVCCNTFSTNSFEETEF